MLLYILPGHAVLVLDTSLPQPASEMILAADACRLYSEVPKLLASIKGLSLLSSAHLLRAPGIAELAQTVLHCEAVMQQLLQPHGISVSLGMLDVLAPTTPHRWASGQICAL